MAPNMTQIYFVPELACEDVPGCIVEYQLCPEDITGLELRTI
jgi:hypothetical protein